jgi:1,4-dihydroxy-2-naphthoate octaprenyltransferase
MRRDTFRAWYQASRPPFFIATLAPLLIGWILGKGDCQHAERFLLVILGSFFVHLATNLANDYFEHLIGTDSGESIGGSRVIQEGKIPPGSLLKAIVLLYFLAFVVAFIIMIAYDLFIILPLILFAFFSSLFYVGPPVRYGYHGLGELFVGLNMGPVMVAGTYWVARGHIDTTPFYVSVPVGLMVASILYYQSLPDMKTDLAAGKYTLAVKLGKRGALIGLALFWIAIYLSIIGLIIAGFLTWYSIFSLLSIPLFIKMVHTARVTEDWVLLDRFGHYVRILYVFNSIAIIAGLL